MAAKSNKSECLICIESVCTFNITECPICNFECCKGCMKKFVLNNQNDNIVCMNCKGIINRDISIDLLGKSFITGKFNQHQKNVRIDKQMALLPETQYLAENVKKVEKINVIISKYNEEVKKIYDKIHNLIHEARELSIIKKNTNKVEYMWSCGKEECNGFLNSTWKCGLCDNITCKDCFDIILNEEHVCDEDKKKTTAMIKKDTKPCPSCGTGIHKTQGCDQIYCVKCNTAFSWKTGKIETGRIHNPHYYEYLRKISKNGEIPREVERNPLNMICNEAQIDRPMDTNISRLFSVSYVERYGSKFSKYVTYVLKAIRFYNHLSYCKASLERSIEVIEEQLRDYRVKFLLNLLEKELMAKNTNIKYKKKEFEFEKIQLINTLMVILQEFILQSYNTYMISGINYTLKKEEIEEFMKSVDEFDNNLKFMVKYTMKADEKLAETYGSVKRIEGINDGLLLKEKSKITNE